MRSRFVLKILLIVLLILLASPLLGALAMMSTGSSYTELCPTKRILRLLAL